MEEALRARELGQSGRREARKPDDDSRWEN